jgi:hypothetical protein
MGAADEVVHLGYMSQAIIQALLGAPKTRRQPPLQPEQLRAP